ncbi:MAG: MotA/TolQ/ExbB proton channel family protein [Candidatus Omnitrophica bacterium]|nr:MotA/TolQ/ExbB proton channel family protein [Candidatus Omnitrophota bacterium]
MIDLMIKGGPIMIPILLCSVLSVAVILERLYHMQRATINTPSFLEDVVSRLQRNKLMEAIDICERTSGPVAHVVKAAVLKHDRSRQEMREAVEEAGMQEIPRLNKNLGILSTIAQIAPLLGLLGTVAGMISAFQVIQEKASALYPVSPGDLAGGISQALITTMAGLMVAIPTFVAYHYFTSRANQMIMEMDRSGASVINLLSEKEVYV